MTEPTFNEQIEAYLTEVERLRARIDRLKAENARLKGGQHVNEPGVGPMARLKQENRDLEAENARLKTENENARERIIYHSGGWNDD